MSAEEVAAQLAQMREGLMVIADVGCALREAVNGYRAQLIADDYSPTAAEAMAIDYHRSLLADRPTKTSDHMTGPGFPAERTPAPCEASPRHADVAPPTTSTTGPSHTPR